jgi:hypothetical protein
MPIGFAVGQWSGVAGCNARVERRICRRSVPVLRRLCRQPLDLSAVSGAYHSLG